jgi:chemotaxis protein CheY-P-specific phosphatase CheC
MTTSVLICDDSSFARKQIARVLPANWDITLSFASNGREGIEAIRAGKGDVLFLDLTMPDLDGFQVLEYIRAHDLPTLPIVVSGDIQPESQQRVSALGAIAFIKKPVDDDKLASVLRQFGLLEHAHAPTQHHDEALDFFDWNQEIANVAMGRAASLLAGVIHEGVTLSIPKVHLLEESELRMSLANAGERGVSVVAQGFIGAGITGETLLFFDDSSVPALAQLMYFGQLADTQMTQDLLMDVGNVLVGAFLKGLTEQMEIKFSQGHPQLYLHAHHDALLRRPLADKTLAIELSYQIGHAGVRCEQLLLFTEHSIAPLRQRMEMMQP